MQIVTVLFCISVRKAINGYARKINPRKRLTLEKVMIVGIQKTSHRKAVPESSSSREKAVRVEYFLLRGYEWNADDSSLRTWHGGVPIAKLTEPRNLARQNTCYGNSDNIARGLRRFVSGKTVVERKITHHPQSFFIYVAYCALLYVIKLQ